MLRRVELTKVTDIAEVFEYIQLTHDAEPIADRSPCSQGVQVSEALAE